MISLDVATLNAQIEAHRSAREYVELKINDAPVKVIDAQYPEGTKLCVYREGPWYEAADDYHYTGVRWIVTRSYFGPYFDGSLDHTVVYGGGEQA